MTTESPGHPGTFGTIIKCTANLGKLSHFFRTVRTFNDYATQQFFFLEFIPRKQKYIRIIKCVHTAIMVVHADAGIVVVHADAGIVVVHAEMLT